MNTSEKVCINIFLSVLQTSLDERELMKTEEPPGGLLGVVVGLSSAAQSSRRQSSAAYIKNNRSTGSDPERVM